MQEAAERGMKTIVEKLAALERRLSEEKGPFRLFALFLRENSHNRWDLVVAAPWLDSRKRADLDFIAGLVSSELEGKEVVNLSRVVILDNDNEEIDRVAQVAGEIANRVYLEGKVVELTNCVFFGLEIRHAYLIATRPDIASRKDAAWRLG